MIVAPTSRIHESSARSRSHHAIASDMRLLLAVLLTTLSTSTWASWVKYGESDHATYYYDPATIEKNGNLTRVWQFQDFKKPASDGSRSIRFLSEFDCAGSRYRILQWSTHSEETLRGDTIAKGGKVKNWIDIAPQTSFAAVREDLCRAEPATGSGKIKDARRETVPEKAEFVVQIAALADQDKIEALVARLAAAKIPYYTETMARQNRTLTRVRAGPFASRTTAEKVRETLKEMGLKPGEVFVKR
jgi:Surface-adhesin protein E/SPOR domain